MASVNTEVLINP